MLNGIVENWTDLREQLVADGATFTSETDAEVVAHLVAHHFDGDLTDAVRRAYNDLSGHYAFVAMSADEPGVLVGARKECPLVVGVGEGEGFIASAIPAFLAQTRRVMMVENGEIVSVTPEGTTFINADGATVERSIDEVDWDEEEAEKNGYDTFMLKEIHEQPDAVAETVADRVVGDRRGPRRHRDLGRRADGHPPRDRCGLRHLVPRGPDRPLRHRGLGAGCHVEIDIASEFRYRNPVLDEHDLVVGISQSGETADTLAAMRLARERGSKVLAVTNVMGSQATRDADGVIFTRAGLEIGVAATKTFVAQVAVMYLLALKLAQVRGHARARGAQHASATSCASFRTDHDAPRARGRAGPPDRESLEGRRLLPLSRAAHRPARVPRGRAEAQGDLLHPDRRLRRRRDEARPDRAARRRTRRWCAWPPTRPCWTR